MNNKKLRKLETAIKYRFRHKRLLIQALTHKSSISNLEQNFGKNIKTRKFLHFSLSFKSYVCSRRQKLPCFKSNLEKSVEVQSKENMDNERLEFLGDAVLDLVISDYLYRSYPDYREGELTKFRSHLVNAPRLLKKAREINLKEYIIWGEEGGREEKKDSAFSDAYEAIIGAIYLDKGIKAATKFIYFHFNKEIKSIEQGEYERDYKSFLQEFSLRRYKKIPSYNIISTDGEEHRKRFKVEVTIEGEVRGQGSGLTIKRAQQAAAQAALEHFGENPEEKFVSTRCGGEK